MIIIICNYLHYPSSNLPNFFPFFLFFFFLMFLQPPFSSGNRQKIQQKIVKDKIKLPAFLSSEAHSLLKGVSKLLSSPILPFDLLISNVLYINSANDLKFLYLFL